MAVARDLKGLSNNVVCVIGDGAMSAGMAYEAMNNAERWTLALSLFSMTTICRSRRRSALCRPIWRAWCRDGRIARCARPSGSSPSGCRIPRAARTRHGEYARGLVTGGTLFEELGFFYIGPIDGHNLDHLLPVLKNVRDTREGPVLVHVVTQKGKGYAPAEASDDKYHGVVKFDVTTGKQDKPKSNAPSYTKVFGESLVKEARKDDRIVAITAACRRALASTFSARRFRIAPSTLASPSSMR